MKCHINLYVNYSKSCSTLSIFPILAKLENKLHRQSSNYDFCFHTMLKNYLSQGKRYTHSHSQT
jgi:hypothetical protein